MEQRLESRLVARAQLALDGAIVALGCVIRFAPVLAADFPLNDGGLIAVMIDELRGAGFVPPAFTSYDLAGIPYAYPPLSFYVGGAVAALTGLTSAEVLRSLPALFASLSVLGFLLFARALLGRGVASSAATLVFALVPSSYLWFVMGGGLPRALGLFCATLALRELVVFYRTGQSRHGAGAAIAAACTLTSHLQVAWFLAVSTVFMLVALRPTLRALAHTVAIGSAAAVLAAPWWLGLVIARHGLAPFVATAEARAVAAGVPLGDITGLRFGREPLFPLTSVLALAGCGILARRKLFALLAWVLFTVFLDPRSDIGVPIPLAIVAGVAVDALGRIRLPVPVRLGLAGTGALFMVLSALVAGLDLVSLTRDARQTMTWISDHTTTDARVLVLSGEPAATDSASEWLPALARRRSVATSQGLEWRFGEFRPLAQAHADVQLCADGDCLAAWSERTGLGFDAVVLVPSRRGTCCAAIAGALANDDRYRLMHSDGDVRLYASVR